MDIQDRAVISPFEYPLCGISPGPGGLYRVQGAIEPLIRHEHVDNWMRMLPSTTRNRKIQFIVSKDIFTALVSSYQFWTKSNIQTNGAFVDNIYWWNYKGDGR